MLKRSLAGLVRSPFVLVLAVLLLTACGKEAAGSPKPLIPAPLATFAPDDRHNCAEIRGTEYRSEAERQWYTANCLGRVTATPSRPAAIRPTCGAPANPFGFDSCAPGQLITAPPPNFCSVLDCSP